MADGEVGQGALYQGRFHVIAGLGNPGERYAKTRHNAGFMVVDRLFACAEQARGFRIVSGSGWQEKFGAQVCPVKMVREVDADLTDASAGEIGAVESDTVWLVKPQDYMNRSGRALAALLGFYKIPVTELIVVHDELDVPLGRLRIKRGGGDGGHNGLRSVTELCGGADYARLRFGIDRPPRLPMQQGTVETGSEEAVTGWVLGRFGSDELPVVSETLGRAVEALKALLIGGVEMAQNRFN